MCLKRFFRGAVSVAVLCLVMWSPFESMAIDNYRVYDFMVDGLAYRVNDDGNTLAVVMEQPRGMFNYEGLLDVVIPETVTFHGKTYTVTIVANAAFLNYNGIGQSYESFGAFRQDEKPSLKSVSLPATLTTIETQAFAGNKDLLEITIPNNVTSIESFAFEGCSNMQVNVRDDAPEAVTSGLTGTKWYEEHYPNSNQWTDEWYNAQPDGVVYQGTKAVAYKGDIPDDGVIVFREGTTYIARFLANNDDVKKVVLPSTLVTLESYAFQNCHNLSEIEVPQVMPEITIPRGTFGNTAWWDNQPSGIVYLGTMAYQVKYNLGGTNMTFNEGTTIINEYLFSNQTNLTSVTIPGSVTLIGRNAFAGCKALTSTVMPNSVRSLGTNVFSDCTALRSITMSNSITEIPNFTC